MKIAPEIFAAHAQFGGDLELMQKAYEWHDLKAKVRELEELVAEYRDHSRPYWQARAEAAEALLKESREALEPFVSAFQKRRVTYAARHSDHVEIGFSNFDKMPDEWPMDTIVFTMGDFRRAARALKEKP
ncbi:MAG: hypothetical protein ACK43M_21420 [Allorhizobium sp.]